MKSSIKHISALALYLLALVTSVGSQRSLPVHLLIFVIKVGTIYGGILSDKVIVRSHRKRGGEWHTKDRLKAAIPGVLVIAPLSVLFSGLLTKYVPGKVGLVLDLVCLFFNGVGVSLIIQVNCSLVLKV